MQHVAVTGGSGKAGKAVVSRLSEAGYDVLNLDVAAPPEGQPGGFMNADLTDLGATVDALRGIEAVVHLAAVPAPRMRPDAETFRINVTSTYNVFSAARTLGLKRVVWASSETVLGLPFVRHPPLYAPVDEDHPLHPETSYALSKVVGEELSRRFNDWSGVPIVGLRFSNVIEPHEYGRFQDWQDDADARRWNAWGYVDVRDVAQSCQRGLEADIEGAEAFIIAAADTVMERPSRELLAEGFPDAEVHEPLEEFGTLQAIGKARAMLGYEPVYSWKTEVDAG